jgi:hypothetical protein
MIMSLALSPPGLKGAQIDRHLLAMPLHGRGGDLEQVRPRRYSRQALFEKKQRLAQVMTGAGLSLFRPKQGCQPGAAVGDIGFDGQIGQQGACMLGGKFEGLVIPSYLNSSQKLESKRHQISLLVSCHVDELIRNSKKGNRCKTAMMGKYNRISFTVQSTFDGERDFFDTAQL